MAHTVSEKPVMIPSPAVMGTTAKVADAARLVNEASVMPQQQQAIPLRDIPVFDNSSASYSLRREEMVLMSLVFNLVKVHSQHMRIAGSELLCGIYCG